MTGNDSSLVVAARALWDARPTTGKRSERYLADALGYPRTWRVVRRILEAPSTAQGGEAAAAGAAEGEEAKDDKDKNESSSEPQQQDNRYMIVDRIYAGSPSEGVDAYFNHFAAQTAALDWQEGTSTGFENKGGQLLPRKPKFQKGDSVKVMYEDVWCLATIKKRTEKKSDGTFRYTVYYPEDGTTQGQVLESNIQMVVVKDAYAVAKEMGLTELWQAKCTGGKKWTFTSPDGKTFSSKATALKHQKKLEQDGGGDGTGTDQSTKKGRTKKTESADNNKAAKKKTPAELMKADEGDPPWRTLGHPYIGRRVAITNQHKKSATRTVSIEQFGTVMGWIAETDVDQHGNPGFVSERTNEPANLFHVVFDDEPGHPYFPLLVESQDLEEWELENALLPTEEEAAAAGSAAAGEEDVKKAAN
jgi:hypothetical protein